MGTFQIFFDIYFGFLLIFQRNKAQRVRQTTKKIETAQKIKETEKKTQRERLKEKHKRAEEQRTSKHLGVKLKAKDESQKVREVNFIQVLEQDIKRCESVKKIQKYESQTKKHASTIEEQKELKARENEMKELAVIDRKKKLECKRQSWVNELNLKRTERNSGEIYFITKLRSQAIFAGFSK